MRLQTKQIITKTVIMKTIKILMILLFIAVPSYGQNENKMKAYQNGDNFHFVEEITNTRTHSPLLKKDGTPHPGWRKFGFKSIGGYTSVYRAIKEVLTSEQINTLVSRGKEMDVCCIFDLNGNVIEVAFSFYPASDYSAFASVITLEQFYEIAQKVKVYDKIIITEYDGDNDEEDVDVQWLRGIAMIDFKKVRDWQP